MKHFEEFIFKSYSFDHDNKQLTLTYSLDDSIEFNEKYRFDFDFVEFDKDTLDRALQLLFLVAGVSYFKTYLPPKITVNNVNVDDELADFLAKTYQKGLGEFFFTNNLDPNTTVEFPVTSEFSNTKISSARKNDGLLIAIGGGKDSLVSTEILRSEPKVATWSLNHREQLEPLITKIGLPHMWVDREIDPKLLSLNREDGVMNGHIPISAIIAAVGVVVAILSGYRDIVVSNENSANEATMTYRGIDINHQYSKTSEFELSFQEYLTHVVGDSIRYYSFLRPLSELHIAKLFSKLAFDKYKSVFSSCNKAFVHDQNHMSWCGECPKCAFTFLILTPFIDKSGLEKIWNRNLLIDESLEITYKKLLGIEGDKPFDCVGEIKESRSAMQLAKQTYPELEKYEFQLPKDYNFMSLAKHNMPEELFAKLKNSL
ncbi:hypothetical protein KDA00_03235 [Candidatus Saccharibacteria bacterium]|nr:hypothetical protein [Candidatus Saccharibacteria bacterium]